MEGANEAAVTYGGCPLEHGSAHARDGAVQVGPLVEVHAGKVQFAEVPGIVHVIKQGVHIVGEAQTWNEGLKRKVNEKKDKGSLRE